MAYNNNNNIAGVVKKVFKRYTKKYILYEIAGKICFWNTKSWFLGKISLGSLSCGFASN